MKKAKHHWIKGHEVSIIELINDIGVLYKVTKRVPDLSVSETRFFRSKESALKQLSSWLE